MKIIELEPAKTYATEANAIKAIARFANTDLRAIIMRNNEGRFFPIFLGQQAMQHGVHFCGFSIVG